MPRISLKMLRRTLISLPVFTISLLLQFRSAPSLDDQALPLPVFSAPAAEAISTGLPLRIRIPAIRVNAQVLAMGVTAEGKMDVPANRTQVSWYKKGSRPGEEGTAVIGGHLELSGKLGIFWNLRKLQVGNVLYIVDEKGKLLTFRIRRREQYHVKNAPLDEIFLAQGGKYLNLITCAGKWDKKLGHYDERLVIFSEFVPEKELAETKSAYTARRS